MTTLEMACAAIKAYAESLRDNDKHSCVTVAIFAKAEELALSEISRLTDDEKVLELHDAAVRRRDLEVEHLDGGFLGNHEMFDRCIQIIDEFID